MGLPTKEDVRLDWTGLDPSPPQYLLDVDIKRVDPLAIEGGHDPHPDIERPAFSRIEIQASSFKLKPEPERRSSAGRRKSNKEQHNPIKPGWHSVDVDVDVDLGDCLALNLSSIPSNTSSTFTYLSTASCTSG